MNDYKELVENLREEADAVQSIAIEFNIPISAENHSREAADVIEQLAMDIDVLTKDRDEFAKTSKQFEEKCKQLERAIEIWNRRGVE